MDTPNFLEKLASQFGMNASVKNVFGEPIQAGDKTIIPVAQIAYGLGGGYGQGSKKDKPALSDDIEMQGNNKGEGAGGGGGMYARPKGVYEVTLAGTRFIPVIDTKQLLIGIAIGFMLKSLLRSKKSKRVE